MADIKIKRKAFVAQQYCVACGCCAKVCPMGAIEIYEKKIASARGIFAPVYCVYTASVRYVNKLHEIVCMRRRNENVAPLCYTEVLFKTVSVFGAET